MTFSNQGVAEQLLPRHNLQFEVTLTALNVKQNFSFYPTTLGGTLSTQSGIVRNYKSLKSQSKMPLPSFIGRFVEDVSTPGIHYSIIRFSF